KHPTEIVPPPRFMPASEIRVALPEGDRWARNADFSGPNEVVRRARARFGAGVAAFDADGDGKLDLYLTSAVVSKKGIRDALLLNQGDGKFADATREWGLPDDRSSLGA